MKRLDYIASGGESHIFFAMLIGKDLLACYKDGKGCSPIITSFSAIPVNSKQVRLISLTGTVSVAIALTMGEKLVLLYQDKPT